MYHRVNLDMLQPIKKWCSYTLVNQGEDDKRNVFGLCSLPPTLKNLTLIPDQNLRTDVTVTTNKLFQLTFVNENRQEGDSVKCTDSCMFGSLCTATATQCSQSAKPVHLGLCVLKRLKQLQALLYRKPLFWLLDLDLRGVCMPVRALCDYSFPPTLTIRLLSNLACR